MPVQVTLVGAAAIPCGRIQSARDASLQFVPRAEIVVLSYSDGRLFAARVLR